MLITFKKNFLHNFKIFMSRYMLITLKIDLFLKILREQLSMIVFVIMLRNKEVL